MADIYSPRKRSEVMSRVKGSNTKPELVVRRLLHSLGYRFRLHRRDLPGSPDIVLPRYRVAIFVHGCFWHRHPGCKRATLPATRADWWRQKLERNRARDLEAEQRLRESGWHPITVWECQVRDTDALAQYLDAELKRPYK